MAKAHFILDPSEELSAEALKSLMPGTQWVEDQPEQPVRTYLDSFDWRLYKANTILELKQNRVGYRLTWRELGSGKVLDERTVTKAPRLAGDCASPVLRKRFTELLHHRALMDHISVASNTRSLRLLDDEGKTVLRIELRQDDLLPVKLDSNATLPPKVYLFPYRGFQESFDKTLHLLETRAGLALAAEDPLLAASRSAGVALGKYTNKPSYVFEPDTPTQRAVRSILASLVDVMLVNVDGICKNLDTEFLHDFLLAVRRTRCILNEFPGTFDERAINLTAQDLTWLEEELTPTRDLDIYLTLFKDYESRLPPHLRQVLIPLSNFLGRQRVRTHQKARLALESPRFKNLMRNWQRLLAIDAPSVPPRGPDSTIAAAAGQSIQTHYRCVLDKGMAIDLESATGELLDLYQRCKRLGYLLEIFRSLYPHEAYSAFMKELRALQQNMNQFHDLDLQQQALHEAGIAMKQDQRILPVWLDAIEVLVANLTEERGRIRRALTKQFARFSRKKVRKQFHALSRKKNKLQEHGI